MGGFHLNEEYIREALHTAAYSCNPPEELKQQIDARLAWQEKKEVVPMKKNNIKKTAVAAALACVLTGTVCMAAERLSSYYYIGSSVPFTEVTHFADIEKLEKKTNIHTDAQELFDNGFVFESANIADVSEADAEGNRIGDGFQEITISYKNGDKNVDYSIRRQEREYTKEELARMQAMESDGMTYYFSQDNYLFIPAGYEPTAEEKEAEAAGRLFISEGSSEREEEVYKSISWSADGQSYLLYGADLDMSAEELLDMAKQMK